MAGGRNSGISRRNFLIGAVSSPIAYKAGGILVAYELAELLKFLKKAGAEPARHSEALSRLEKEILNVPYDSSSGRQQSITVLENRDGSINPAPASIISRSDLADRTTRLFGQYDTTPDITGIDLNGALYLLGKGNSRGQQKFLASLPDGRISDVTQILMDFFQTNQLLSYLIRQGIVPLDNGQFYRLAFNLDGNRVHLYDLNGPTIAIDKGDVTQDFRRMFSFVPLDLMSTTSTLYLPRGDGTADTHEWQRIRAELSGSSPQRVITPPVALSRMFPGSRTRKYFSNPGGQSVLAVSDLENRIDGGLSDYWDGRPQSGAVAEIRNGNVVVGRATTDNEGRFSFGDLQEGNYDVLFRQQGRVHEGVNLNVRGNTDLRWSNADVNEPMDLYEALFINAPYPRSVRFRNPEQLNYQIVTSNLPPDIIKAAKLLIRAGVDVPESSIQEVSANPRYGPGTFVVQLSNDSFDNLLPRDSVSVRIMALEGDNISNAIIVLKPELFTTFNDIRYKTIAKEIIGALKGVIGDPDPYLGDPIGLKYQNNDIFISRGVIPEFEQGFGGLLSRGRIDNPRNAVYPTFPIVTQKVLRMAEQRYGGQIIGYFDDLRYLYSTVTERALSGTLQRQGLERVIRRYVTRA